MAYRKRPFRKPRRKPTKPRRMRKSAPKTSLGTFKKMLAKVSEKKRFYIAPVALTNGDITCVAPQASSKDGGNSTGFIQPFLIGQQYTAIGSMGYASATMGGWAAFDMTPHPTENNGFAGREGSSINLNSTYAQFKFAQQSANTLTPIKIKMVILHVLGATQTPQAVMEAYYLNSALPNGSGIGNNNGLIDYNSTVSPDQYGQFRRIYQKSITLKQDDVDAGLQVVSHVIKLKYNKGKGHIIRFLQNTTTVVGGQLIMLMTADAGNSGNYEFNGVGNGTLINNKINSACACNFNICHYFTDP